MPNLKSYSNYSTFGSLMPGRNSGSESYRYSFNGYEKDDEVKNITGGHISFADYGYDSTPCHLLDK